MGRGGQMMSARFKPVPAELTKLRPCLRRPTAGRNTTRPGDVRALTQDSHSRRGAPTASRSVGLRGKEG